MDFEVLDVDYVDTIMTNALNPVVEETRVDAVGSLLVKLTVDRKLFSS